jgi:hypothetical protein
MSDQRPDDEYEERSPVDEMIARWERQDREREAKQAPNGGSGRENVKALGFTLFDQCRETASKEWLIKGVIARNERSSWYGAPKSVKSGLLADIAVHVAAPGVTEWRGYRIKCHGGVLFLAFERAALTRRRLAAYTQRDGYVGLPIAVCGKIIDLLTPECVEIIVAGPRG